MNKREAKNKDKQSKKETKEMDKYHVNMALLAQVFRDEIQKFYQIKEENRLFVRYPDKINIIQY